MSRPSFRLPGYRILLDRRSHVWDHGNRRTSHNNSGHLSCIFPNLTSLGIGLTKIGRFCYKPRGSALQVRGAGHE